MLPGGVGHGLEPRAVIMLLTGPEGEESSTPQNLGIHGPAAC